MVGGRSGGLPDGRRQERGIYLTVGGRSVGFTCRLAAGEGDLPDGRRQEWGIYRTVGGRSVARLVFVCPPMNQAAQVTW